jgi:hypothetical protein
LRTAAQATLEVYRVAVTNICADDLEAVLLLALCRTCTVHDTGIVVRLAVIVTLAIAWLIRPVTDPLDGRRIVGN